MVKPDWHFTLSDGVTTLQMQCSDPAGRERSLRHWTRQPLDRTAMKLGSGRTRYDDLVPPWYAIAQDDWSGGRGELNLLDDPTKYSDAHGVQTWIPKRMVLGPAIHTDLAGSTTIEHDFYVLGGMKGHELLGVSKLAQTFTVSRTISSGDTYIMLSFVSFVGSITVELWPTLNGKPNLNGVRIGTQTRTETVSLDEDWYGFALPCQLEPGVYAIVVSATGTGSLQWIYYPQLGYDGGAPWEYIEVIGGDPPVSTWMWLDPGGEDQSDFLFRLVTLYDVPDDSRVWFYHANGLLHATFSGKYTNYIYRRGQLGQSTAVGGEYTLTDSGASFTSAAHGGQVVTLIGGTGAGQRRAVTSVTTTQLTVSERWAVKPDATTLYAITGTWQLVTSMGGTIRDVLVIDEVTYFARGAEDYLARHRWTDAGGEEIASDGTNKADRLALFRDKDNVPAIWRSLGNELSAANLVDWGTNLTFGTAMRVGSEDSRITGLVVYDDHLYIGKEDGLWAIEDDVVRHLPVHFEALRSQDNCAAMVPWNLYLIFPILHSLQRMYSSTVDDFGPNIGRGLPTERQGPISAILPLPGLLVVGVDGGRLGYSSVMCYNNLGWHEIARSTTAGARITALAYEVLDTHARLWWNEGSYLYYAWMSRTVFDGSRDPAARFTSSGTLTMSWLGADLEDVTKIWSKVVVIKEQDQTFEGVAAVSLEYRVNDEGSSWTVATQTSTSDTRDEFSLANVVGRRLQLRLTLTQGGDYLYGYTTPEIIAVTVDALGRVNTGVAFNTHAILDTIAISMQGSPARTDPATVLAKLDSWASSPTPLTLRHALPEFDNTTVLLEPVRWSLPEYSADGELAPRVVAIPLVVM